MKKDNIKKTGTNDQKKIALGYIETLVEVAREPFLILSPDLFVISANPMFYDAFHVTSKETKGKLISELGNGQWDIPELRELLEKILPEQKIVRNYEVEHTFERVGEKTILLNARQLDSVQLIVVAMEDITERKTLEKKLAEHAANLEVKISERTEELAKRIKELEALNKTMVGREMKMIELKEEVRCLKEKTKNGNGKNGNGKNGKKKNGNGKNGR